MGRLIGWLHMWVQLHMTLMGDLRTLTPLPPLSLSLAQHHPHHGTPGGGWAPLVGGGYGMHHQQQQGGGESVLASLHGRGAALLSQLHDGANVDGISDAEWESLLPQLVSLVTTRARYANPEGEQVWARARRRGPTPSSSRGLRR